ncbi:maleylacetate reductase [Streptomyces sp. WG-D5]
MRFVHETLAQRVHFATGEARAVVRAEVERCGGSHVMVIASPRESERAAALTGDVPVAVRHDEVVMHVPVEAAERARAVAAAHSVDLVVTVGGGSATGLAKAIALTSGVPIVAVPTTYAGSEATSTWGLTEGARKTTGVDPRVLPRAVVYDAELTLSLPVATSVASGLNALAHCVDSMWAPRTDPIDQALASEGVRALADGLPKVAADPAGLDGRERTLYGAYLSAVAFSSAGSGLHHKICHVLGGTYGLPHAETHAVVLPYVLAFNAPAAPSAAHRLASAFGTDSALAGLQHLRRTVAAPTSLRALGLDGTHAIDTAATAIASTAPPSNPRRVTESAMRRLLRAAWEGADPGGIGPE